MIVPIDSTKWVISSVERLVLDLKMRGKTNHEVASELGVSWEEVARICGTLKEKF